MVESLHVFSETRTQRDGQVTIRATVEQHGQERRSLWYRVPEEFAYAVTPSSDPFVLSILFKAMRERTDLVIHGEVSPALLRNLEEFQSVWAMCLPQRYAAIEIQADTVKEQPRAAHDGALCAISGGVDGLFTARRHRMGLCGRRARNLQAGVFVQGFDIPLKQNDVYAYALGNAREMLASIGMQVIPLATNIQSLHNYWFDVFGSAVVSCLMLLQGGWNTGLIASSDWYDALEVPYGSSCLTDRMLSSGAFTIVHDGADAYRVDKVRTLMDWPEARKHLRVCWQSDLFENCCRCRKCVRTILEFRAVGAGLPECFARDVRNWQILTSGSAAIEYEYHVKTLARAKERGVKGSWLWALGAAAQIGRARGAAKKIVTRARDKN